MNFTVTRLGWFVVALSMIFSGIGCSNKSENNSSDSNSSKNNSDNKKPTDQTEQNNNNHSNNNTSQLKKMSEIVAKDDLKKIIGKDFDNIRESATFTNIISCEYYSKDKVVMITVANGSAAKDRITKDKFNKTNPISGIGERAIWEPVQGKLAVESKGLYIDVIIAKSLGDEKTRIEFSKEIVKLILDRY